MNRFIAIVALLPIALTACIPTTKDDQEKKSQDWKTISSEAFTMQVPTHLKEVSNLHEDAVVQLQNPIREFYTIVIQESQKEFHDALITGELQDEFPLNLDGYSNLVREKFIDNVDEVFSKSDFQSLPIKKGAARYFEAEAKVSGIKIYYHYGFVAGDSLYYQVMSWTLASKKEKTRADMMEILGSFKEK